MSKHSIDGISPQTRIQRSSLDDGITQPQFSRPSYSAYVAQSRTPTRVNSDVYVPRPRASIPDRSIISSNVVIAQEIEVTRPAQPLTDLIPGTQKVSASMASVLMPARGIELRKNWIGLMLIAISIVILITVAFSTYDTWRQNQELRKDVTTARVATDSTVREGTDETQVTGSDVNSYAVSADMPRILHIPRIDVKARVFRMGISDGTIQAPENVWDTGWYQGSAKPGEKGTAFIDGHISGPSQPAVFHKLSTLTKGDRIEVERGDGTIIRYSVSAVETIPLKDVDMQSILNSSTATESLVLMTCGGEYMGNYKYDSRVVVHATRDS